MPDQFTPHSTDHWIRTTLSTKRAAELARGREEARRHFTQLTRAIERYGPRNLREFHRELARISPRAAGEYSYMNPAARVLWLRNIFTAFEQSAVDLSDARTLTLIDQRWFTTREHWNFDLDAIKRRLWAGLRGLNYIGMIEFAWFVDRGWRGDELLIAPHFQGVVWDVSEPRLAAARRRFSGGLDGTVPLWCRRVDDLAGALSYAVKAPCYGYSAGRPRPDRPPKRCSRRLTLAMHYFFFTRLGDYSFPALAVAGGRGVDVLRAARAATR
jgi:hypothetical protein